MSDTQAQPGWPTAEADQAVSVLADWTWLVHLCARFVPDRATAEDLAQETLILAWQHAHELRDPAARPAWLAGIARRRCLMWGRRHQRAVGRGVNVSRTSDAPAAAPLEHLPDELDLELQLERDELADLLDRALALLPATTGQALVQHYIEGRPPGEIAARLGVSVGTLAVRLHRGKVALRRVLTTQLAHEAAAHGLPVESQSDAQETRVWCPSCGQQRLRGRMGGPANALLLRCPVCDRAPGSAFAHIARLDTMCPGIKGYKPALNRLLRWTAAYWAGLVDGRMPCPLCQRPTHWRVGPDDADPARRPAAWAACDACRCRASTDIGGIALGQPAAQQFWRANPRMRILPPREVEVAGRAALVTHFESVTGSATLDIVSAGDTFATLAVTGAPDA